MAMIEMQKKKFKSYAECDGANSTCRQKHSKQNILQAIWAIVQRLDEDEPLNIAVFFLPRHTVAMNGVCPRESKDGTLNTKGFNMIETGRTLMTDGARCFPDLAASHGLKHVSVPHCKGKFASTHVSRLWRRVKEFIPSQVKMQAEPLLRQYVFLSWLCVCVPDA